MKKLIELQISNGKPGDKGANVEYLDRANNDTCLLITAPKLESATNVASGLRPLKVKDTGCRVADDWRNITVDRTTLKKVGLTADRQSIELLLLVQKAIYLQHIKKLRNLRYSVLTLI